MSKSQLLKRKWIEVLTRNVRRRERVRLHDRAGRARGRGRGGRAQLEARDRPLGLDGRCVVTVTRAFVVETSDPYIAHVMASSLGTTSTGGLPYFAT